MKTYVPIIVAIAILGTTGMVGRAWAAPAGQAAIYGSPADNGTQAMNPMQKAVPPSGPMVLTAVRGGGGMHAGGMHGGFNRGLQSRGYPGFHRGFESHHRNFGFYGRPGFHHRYNNFGLGFGFGPGRYPYGGYFPYRYYPYGYYPYGYYPYRYYPYGYYYYGNPWSFSFSW